jgi:hypothetical protein
MFEPIQLGKGFGVDVHPNKPDAYMVTKHGRRYSPPGKQYIFDTPEAAVRAVDNIIKEIEESEERENKLVKGESGRE